MVGTAKCWIIRRWKSNYPRSLDAGSLENGVMADRCRKHVMTAMAGQRMAVNGFPETLCLILSKRSPFSLKALVSNIVFATEETLALQGNSSPSNPLLYPRCLVRTHRHHILTCCSIIFEHAWSPDGVHYESLGDTDSMRPQPKVVWQCFHCRTWSHL